jgi:hypothetical protein
VLIVHGGPFIEHKIQKDSIKIQSSDAFSLRQRSTSEMSEVTVLDHEGSDFVFDNASIVQINAKDPHDGCMLGLRFFGFKRGFATPFGVPGHFLVNKLDEESETQVVVLPCVVSFLDVGNADRLCVAVKRTAQGKMFAICVELPLCVSGTDDTSKWVQFRDAATVKLSVIKSFSSVVSSDGHNLVKNVDKWLKDFCALTKGVEIKSLKDCRSWCSAGRYGKNVAKVIHAAELNLRREVKKNAGGSKAADKVSKGKGAADAHAVELAAIETQVEALKLVKEQLLSKETYYKVPLGSRIIEFALPARIADEVVDIAGLEALIKNESSQAIAIELTKILNKTTISTIVAAGKAPPVLASPAVKSKPPPPPVVEKEPELVADEAVQDVDVDSDIELPQEVAEESEGEEDDVVEVEQLASGDKRKRTPIARLADEPLPRVKLTKKEKIAAKKAIAKMAIKKAGGPKRTYIRSNLYSSDPQKAAVARAKLGGLSASGGGVSSPDYSSPSSNGDRPNSNCPNS